MKAGIVILNYNDAASVVKLADSITGYASLGHIVIVDNCSTDDSFVVLRQRYEGEPRVSVLSSQKNGGYSYGNNYGARYLMEHYPTEAIFIANPDVLFQEELVISILETFEKQPEYGVLTGVMTAPDGSVAPMPYRDFFSYAHDLGDCFLTVRRLVYEKRRGAIDYSVPVMTVPVIQGSFFAITAQAFRKIGGLDEGVFLYYEEMILGKRLQKAGYRTGVLTGQSYIHDHSVSIRRSMKNLRIWKTVLKSKYYYQKNYNNANVFQMGLLHICGFFSLIEKFFIEVLRAL